MLSVIVQNILFFVFTEIYLLQNRIFSAVLNARFVLLFLKLLRRIFRNS